VDVLGKTADGVATEIIAALGPDFKGGVLVLVGLSGTGKGTTVDMLKSKIPGTYGMLTKGFGQKGSCTARGYCLNLSGPVNLS
jgi:putative ribosome biogenesis GTPase RsgA